MQKAWTITLMTFVGLNAAACTSTSHIGNPLTLPGRAIINGIENASYGTRRDKLKDYATQNLAQIYSDIDAGGGPAMVQAMEIARVPDARRAELITELAAHPDIYRQADIEPLIVAIMVHGD